MLHAALAVGDENLLLQVSDLCVPVKVQIFSSDLTRIVPVFPGDNRQRIRIDDERFKKQFKSHLRAISVSRFSTCLVRGVSSAPLVSSSEMISVRRCTEEGLILCFYFSGALDVSYGFYTRIYVSP